MVVHEIAKIKAIIEHTDDKFRTPELDAFRKAQIDSLIRYKKRIKWKFVV